MSLISKLPKCWGPIFSIFIYFAVDASAEYRLGGYLGVGGTGIKTVSTINNTDVDVQRSNGPGILGASVEFLTSDTRSVSFEHTRGVYLSPFASGVSFTGVTWRWFLGGKAPSVTVKDDQTSYLIVTRKIPFLGVGTGVAAGTITRENDLVPNINASGIYIGFHGGYDYQVDPGKYFRVEAVFAATPTSSGFVKSSLSEFALQIGLFLIL